MSPVMFQDVTVRYPDPDPSRPDRIVLDRFSWSLPDRGSLCLFGPSGCGKTTLLHLLAGIRKPDEGRVLGLEHRTVSMVFQEPRLLPWLNAVHNVASVLPSDQGPEREKTAAVWLDRVGLGEDLYKLPGELSGGMRQRVAVARALAYGGDVLLLDEPTQGLDRATRRRILELLRQNGKRRLTLLVTHNPEEADAMRSDIVYLSGPPVRILPEVPEGIHEPLL